MIQYWVAVLRAPGRKLVHIGTFKAPAQEVARGKAVQVTEQYAHRARCARYRLSWQLYVIGPRGKPRQLVDAGNLLSGIERRREGTGG